MMKGKPPIHIGDGIWWDWEPVVHLGLRLTATMTVLRLGDGGLLLHSPVNMTPERRAAIATLGPVAHLYAPNLYHHRWLGEWQQAYPAAHVHAPQGLARKRDDLRIDRFHADNPPTAFAGIIDEQPIDGFRLEECVLFYRPAGVLIVADLIHNIGRSKHRWTQCYARAMGFYNRVAISRLVRWAAFSDKTSVRRSIEKLLSYPFDRIIVGHGEPLVEDARKHLCAAYRWLGLKPGFPKYPM